MAMSAGRGSHEHHHAYGGAARAVTVKREKRLRDMLADADRSPASARLQPWLAEVFQRIDDAGAHAVLPWVEK